LESFLAQGAVYGFESIVQGVELLAPGHSLWTDWSGRPQKSRSYWQLPFLRQDQETGREGDKEKRSGLSSLSPGLPVSLSERCRAVSDLADILRDAVQSQLLSDAPLGIFLSGGIDSSAVATL